MGKLQIPPGARFSCQGCTDCCRHWAVTVTAEERGRIAAHDWAAEDPDLKGRTLFDPTGRKAPDGTPLFRIRLREDEGCPFLTTDGLCRIHKSLGARAKPLVCQVYPYTFAYTPDGEFVGLRFSCPTVARNGGALLEDDAKAIKELATAFRHQTGTTVTTGGVEFDLGRELESEDATAIEGAVAAAFERPAGLVEQVGHACRILALVAGADLARIRGRVGGFLDLMGGQAEMSPPETRDVGEGVGAAGAAAAVAGTIGAGCGGGALNGAERLLFRRLLQRLCAREYVRYRRVGWRGRLSLQLRARGDALRFLLDRGSLALGGLARPVALRDVDAVASPVADPAVADVLRRYVMTRIFGKSYFGALFLGWGQLGGMELLFLSLAAVCWFARAAALARGTAVGGAAGLDDFLFGVRYVSGSLMASDLLRGLGLRLQLAPLLRPEVVARVFRHFAAPPPPPPPPPPVSATGASGGTSR